MSSILYIVIYKRHACFCCFFLLWAQAGKAELFGTVQDRSGAAVQNISVTAKQEGTNERFQVTTDDRGEYHLLGLIGRAVSLDLSESS